MRENTNSGLCAKKEGGRKILTSVLLLDPFPACFEGSVSGSQMGHRGAKYLGMAHSSRSAVRDPKSGLATAAFMLWGAASNVWTRLAKLCGLLSKVSSQDLHIQSVAWKVLSDVTLCF